MIGKQIVYLIFLTFSFFVLITSYILAPVKWILFQSSLLVLVLRWTALQFPLAKEFAYKNSILQTHSEWRSYSEFFKQ